MKDQKTPTTIGFQQINYRGDLKDNVINVYIIENQFAMWSVTNYTGAVWPLYIQHHFLPPLDGPTNSSPASAALLVKCRESQFSECGTVHTLRSSFIPSKLRRKPFAGVPHYMADDSRE